MIFNINNIYKENLKEIEEIDKIIEEEGLSLFGAGQYGEFACEYLLNNNYKINCFIDNNISRHGQKINGINIVSKYSDLAKKSKIVLITAHHAIDEIILENKELYKYIISFDKWFIINRFKDFLYLRDNMYDDRSREVLDTLIYSKLYGNKYLCETIYENNQYFAIPKFNAINVNEVYIDLGAFVGDTIERFIYNMNGIFKKIYAFEIGIDQFRSLNIRVDRLKKEWAINNDNIILVNAGISNEESEFYINGEGVMSSNRLSKIGDSTIKSYSIDNYFNDIPVTFIKADIEGEELNMLKGAINSIKKYKPKMAISVYHKPDDLLTIPQFIKELVPEYNLSLRHHSIGFDETVLYCWTDQTRPDQTRPILICKEYIYSNNIRIIKKLQPMLQDQIAA
ncbi:FkbM family methyltransferase [uncultured Brachyspira sp.]|uniref:FkbM family methyltransferase n=1 Tax=uncultured Brachyspira sp. TaxID=221953 RepID=UPI00260A7AD8|nr:FkbM family methyltransferase [uncultured Brachyspira sp.]